MATDLWNKVRDKRIWIPQMCDTAQVFAAALRGRGYDAQILPRSPDITFALGRHCTNIDHCLPSSATMEDILRRIFPSEKDFLDFVRNPDIDWRKKRKHLNPGFDPDKEAIFMAHARGPCRLGLYPIWERLILYELGFPNTYIVGLSSGDNYLEMGRTFKLVAWNGCYAQGVLEREMHFKRPFEINKGESQQVYAQSLENLCKQIEEDVREETASKKAIVFDYYNNKIMQILNEAKKRFQQIQTKEEDKPVIFITGEIYVRLNPPANQNLVDEIERAGGVALLEQASSFFDYVNASIPERRKYRAIPTSFWKALKTRVDGRYMDKAAHKIRKIFPFHIPEPTSREIIEHGSRYIGSHFEGEAIVTLGAMDYYAPYVDGIVLAMPHTCMPGNLSAAKIMQIEKKYNIPIANLIYDGFPNASLDRDIAVLVNQAEQRMHSRKSSRH